MAAPAIAVVIPVYNGERFLPEALDSALAQSFLSFELLLVDDGSTDATHSIFQEYAKRDSRIRVLVNRKNVGFGASMMRGIREARAPFVAEMACDDLMLPERLEKQAALFYANPKLVLAGGHLRIIDETGNHTANRIYPTTDTSLRHALVSYNPFGGPTLMYRRDAALACGGYTTQFETCEDYDFVLRLARLGDIANVDEALAEYRMHGGATKSQKTIQQLSDTIAIKRKAYHTYGYRPNLKARAVNAAQAAMLLLPPRIVYWLFSKFILSSPNNL